MENGGYGRRQVPTSSDGLSHLRTDGKMSSGEYLTSLTQVILISNGCTIVVTGSSSSRMVDGDKYGNTIDKIQIVSWSIQHRTWSAMAVRWGCCPIRAFSTSANPASIRGSESAGSPSSGSFGGPLRRRSRDGGSRCPME